MHPKVAKKGLFALLPLFIALSGCSTSALRPSRTPAANEPGNECSSLFAQAAAREAEPLLTDPRFHFSEAVAELLSQSALAESPYLSEQAQKALADLIVSRKLSAEEAFEFMLGAKGRMFIRNNIISSKPGNDQALDLLARLDRSWELPQRELLSKMAVVTALKDAIDSSSIVAKLRLNPKESELGLADLFTLNYFDGQISRDLAILAVGKPEVRAFVLKQLRSDDVSNARGFVAIADLFETTFPATTEELPPPSAPHPPTKSDYAKMIPNSRISSDAKLVLVQAADPSAKYSSEQANRILGELFRTWSEHTYVAIFSSLFGAEGKRLLGDKGPDRGNPETLAAIFLVNMDYHPTMDRRDFLRKIAAIKAMSDIIVSRWDESQFGMEYYFKSNVRMSHVVATRQPFRGQALDITILAAADPEMKAGLLRLLREEPFGRKDELAAIADLFEAAFP